MKKALAALLFAVPLFSCGKNSSNPATETADYKKWTLYQEQAFSIPLAFPTKALLDFSGGVQRLYVEDATKADSKFVIEFEILGKAVIRTVVGDQRTFQLLVNGEWKTGKKGIVPEFFLLDYEALFKHDEMKGVRITLETNAGEVETVVVP